MFVIVRLALFINIGFGIFFVDPRHPCVYIGISKRSLYHPRHSYNGIPPGGRSEGHKSLKILEFIE